LNELPNSERRPIGRQRLKPKLMLLPPFWAGAAHVMQLGPVRIEKIPLERAKGLSHHATQRKLHWSCHGRFSVSGTRFLLRATDLTRRDGDLRGGYIGTQVAPYTTLVW
jgi:hypothetical protein